MKRVFSPVNLSLGMLGVVIAAMVMGIHTAWPYSANDSGFYDGLGSLDAFEPSSSVNVALDPLNGLRLSTDGTPTTSTWTSVSDFTTTTATGPGAPGALVGQLTLDATGSVGAGGSLRLRTSPLALSFNSPEAIVAPSFDATSDRGDSYEVHGPAVVKVGAGDYRMWYTGVAPNGYVQRIFEATSTNGTTWTRVAGDGPGGAVVDVGGEGAFDQRGLVRPAVTYVATATPPFRMFYGTLSDDAGYIGSATSTDGVHWAKTEVATGVPGPVLSPGLPGMADGYSVGEPSVVFDAAARVFHMWYAAGPGPEVGGRQVGYATSTDTSADANGAVWHKGGLVNLPLTGNWNGGWFSPAVWLEGGSTPFGMIFAGKKLGAQPYKLVTTQYTADPTTWQGSNIFLNGTGAWGGNNIFWANVLKEAAGVYKVFYTGNGGSGDAARDAIGMATWNGGSSPTDYVGNPVLRAAAPSARFDSNYTSNGTVVRSVSASGVPEWLMLYAGRAASDLQWRIGAAESTDLAQWTKLSGTGDAGRKAVLPLGAAGSFDASGALAPSVFSIDATAGTLGVLYQARSAAGASSFGLATATVPAVGSWTKSATAVLAPGGLWDALDIAHPSVVRVGSTWRCYYAGTSGVGWSIGYATSADLKTWTKQSQVLTASVDASAAYESAGVYDPVVAFEPSATPAWRMWYTAKDSLGVERIAYATSADGLAWTRQGLSINPSQDPYAFDEIGVRAAGAVLDTSTAAWQVFYTGIDRGNAGVSAGLPYTTQWQRIGRMYGSSAGYIGAGSAVYELVPTGTPVPGYQYDFRTFDWDSVVPTGTTARFYVSFYPAYVQPNGTPVDAWSKYFPIDTSSTPYLPLTTQKVRWRVAFTRDAANTTQTPDLQALRVTWAPTHFETTGSVMSIPVTAAQGRYIDSWKQLKVTVSDVSQNASVTAVLLAEDGQQLLAPLPLSNGANVLPLDQLPPGLPSLRVRFDFTGDGTATSYIKNWGIDYTTTNRAPVADFRGSGTTTSVVLSWTEPDYAGMRTTRVVRRTDQFPTSALDASAAVVYEASSTPNASVQTTDASASVQGQVYYYAAYTSDGSGWSPPTFAIGVPARGVTNLAAGGATGGMRLTWSNGTTTTVPADAWQGTRIFRSSDSTITSPYDTTATVIADVKGASVLDTTTVSGMQYRYGAYEHYSVSMGGKSYHAYSAGTTSTARLTATVTRIQGPNRFDVAVNIAATAFPGWAGIKHVIIACGEDRAMADPLAAAGLAGAYNAPILLVRTLFIPDGVYASLKAIAAANGSIQVHIVGGPGSVPDTLKAQMARIPGVALVDRTGGLNRYEVTANIASKMASVLGAGNVPGALIVSSENPAAFYDALAASPAAFKTHMPMLGVRATLPPDASVMNVLNTLMVGKPRYVVSSPTYISAANYNLVKGTQRLTTVVSQYQASADIASKSIANGWLSAAEVGVAAKLPDALTGGAFMGTRGGVLMFTDSTTVMQAPVRNFISSRKAEIARGWIFGGTASVTSSTETSFRNLLQ